MGSYACERFARSACSSFHALKSTRASMYFARSPTLTDRSISNAESWAVIGFSMAASFAAIIWSWNHAAMRLLY